MVCCRNRLQICTVKLLVLQHVSLQSAGTLTLARKLDKVHINTVNSNNIIPNVRLATPCSPKRSRKVPLPALNDEDLDTPWASSGTEPNPDCDCRREPAASSPCVCCWSASSAGISGSVGAIFSRHLSLHLRELGIEGSHVVLGGSSQRLGVCSTAGTRGHRFVPAWRVVDVEDRETKSKRSRHARDFERPCEQATETFKKREPRLTWIRAGRCRGQVGARGGIYTKFVKLNLQRVEVDVC